MMEEKIKSFHGSKYLTRREAAEYLRVKPQTLAKWASTRFRRIPYRKVGSRVLYDYDDIQAFVEGGQQ